MFNKTTRPQYYASSGIISQSLSAGLEIEKSRLNLKFDRHVINDFSRKISEDPELEALCFTSDQFPFSLKAFRFHLAAFDGSCADAHKAKLVAACAEFHQVLSDELRDHRGA